MVYHSTKTTTIYSPPHDRHMAQLYSSTLCLGHGIVHPCTAACSAQPQFHSWLKFIFPTSSAALTKSTKVRFFAWQKQASADNKRNAATFIFCSDAGVELSICLIHSPPRAHAIGLIMNTNHPLADSHRWLGLSTIKNLLLMHYCLLW